MNKTKRWQTGLEAQENEKLCKRSSSNYRDNTSCIESTDATKFLESTGLWSLAQGPFSNYWFCLAEFNVLLRGFQHTFSDLQLLEFRSFTRSPKSEALEKVAWALGCRSPAEFQQHPHMAALSSVLEVACNDCSEACVSQLTVTTPTWLATWASKWLPSTSDGPPQRITLSVVQAYSSQPPPLRASAVYNIGLPTITTAAPNKTFYLPWNFQ